MDEVFAGDGQTDWLASMERVNDADNRRTVYSHTPVLPHFSPRQVHGFGDSSVAEGLSFPAATCGVQKIHHAAIAPG
jgi:hypothetical protein